MDSDTQKSYDFQLSLIEEFIDTPIPHAFFASTSDLVRYWILREHGGMYTDIDYKLLISPNFILQYVDMLVGELRDMEPLFISNSFIAVKKNHPVLIEVVNSVNDNLKFINDNNYF